MAANNGVLRQTLGRSYKHCGAAGELWGNFGSNWVLDTGYWQETIKNIDKRGNFGETLGATGYWILGTGKKRLKGLLRLTLWSSGETTTNIG